MKKLLIYLVFFLLNLSAKATLPVVDYSHIAQDAANEVVNFAKYAQTAIASAQTELNTLNTYENTVVQVARFGNPAALRKLPAVSTVAELYQLYDPTTNEWASKVIAKETAYKHSLSNSGSLQSSTGFSSNMSVTEVEEDSCPPKKFIGLKNGGKKNEYVVEGILFQSGRLWNRDQRWTVRRFRQT